MIIKKTKFGYVHNLLFISIPLFIMLKILSEFNSVSSLSGFIFLLFVFLLFLLLFVSALAVIDAYAGVRLITYENDVLTIDRHFFKPLKIHITEINNISETFKSIRTQNLVHIHYQNKKISFLKYQYSKEINTLIVQIETGITKHFN